LPSCRCFASTAALGLLCFKHYASGNVDQVHVAVCAGAAAIFGVITWSLWMDLFGLSFSFGMSIIATCAATVVVTVVLMDGASSGGSRQPNASARTEGATG